MKVKDLFISFPDFKILAGEGGLNKTANTVSVMDAPDIYNWMKGGEFLITTGYCMKDDIEKLKDLIIRLNRAGAAALGIKLGRFIDELPPSTVEVANGLDFPIIYIPTKYAFADVINPVLTNIVNSQTKMLMMSERIHNSFFELVINGKKTQDIVNTLSDILKKNVAFKDLFFDEVYVSSTNEYFEDDVVNLDISVLQEKYYTHQVKVTNDFYGYIIIDHNGYLEDLEKITIEHASTVLILDIQRKISNYEVEQKYRNEFIYDLITNNVKSVEEVRNRASMYGWKFDKGFICLIVDIDNFKEKYISISNVSADINKKLEEIKNRIFNVAKLVMKNCFYNCYYASFSDYMVFLIEPDNNIMDQFIKKIKHASDIVRDKVRENTGFTVTIGIGNYKENLLDVNLSFIEAKKAVRISRLINKEDSTVIYSEMGAYKLLYKITVDQEMKEFCDEYLWPLIDYDRENNTEYIRTLRALVDNDWNLKATADKLYIHYNTMKYRFEKICEILNINLKDKENKFSMELALKLMSMAD